MIFALSRSILRTTGVLLLAGTTATMAQADEVDAVPMVVASATVATNAPTASDPQFRSLFNSWKTTDEGVQKASIPSQKPVDAIQVSSSYGMRSDPFTGRAKRHAGIDIPGAIGTPIYATADGVADHAGWMNGYGNLVELNHGRGIGTRYGHMSRLAINPGDRVVKGQVIGYMGSTGRSTGSHLHYEVRIDGSAVNPMPFLASSDYMVALKSAPRGEQLTALGGPDESGDE